MFFVIYIVNEHMQLCYQVCFNSVCAKIVMLACLCCCNHPVFIDTVELSNYTQQ